MMPGAVGLAEVTNGQKAQIEWQEAALEGIGEEICHVAGSEQDREPSRATSCRREPSGRGRDARSEAQRERETGRCGSRGT
jgi:hypothetical protein